MLHQLRACPNDNIEAIDPCFYRESSVVHVAANMGEDFGLKSKVTDDFTISSRLFRGCRRSELDVFDSEGI